jgi:HlyD family secretion protein
MFIKSKVVRRFVMLAAKLAVAGLVVWALVFYLFFSAVVVPRVEARSGSVRSEVMGTGTLEAQVKATISPRISGRLAKLHVDQNDRVTEGQLLAELDDGDLRQKVEVAKAELAAAAAAVDRSAADVTRAEARHRQASRMYDRLLPLREKGAVSPDEFDKATEDRDIVNAELERAKLTKIEAERQVQRAEQSLRYDQERLADTRIVAPFDGLVIRRDRDAGDVVVPGGSILELVSTKQLWVSAWVDETAIGGVAVGQTARVVFRSAPNISHAGQVARVSPQTDRESREFVVDITVDRLPESWSIGQRAEVFIEQQHRDGVLTLPPGAIVWRQRQAGVIVSDAGKARWRPVELGIQGGDAVEIITGMDAGESVALIPPGGEPPADGRRLALR